MAQFKLNRVKHSNPVLHTGFRDKLLGILSPIRIIRPVNCLFSFMCTFFGAIYVGVSPLNPNSWLMAVSATLIAGSGYVINDICDIEIDRINQPQRVLPSARMTVQEARVLTLAMGLCGILISLFSPNIWHLIIASANLFLLIMYAVRLKKSGLPGNLIVAWSAGSTFLYGALSGHNPLTITPIMAFAFLYTIIREITKTIEDYEGDNVENAKTIAVRLGKKKAAQWLIFPISLIFTGICLFYFTKMTNSFVFVMLNLLVFIPLIFFYIVLNRSQHPQIVRKIHNWMKLDMFVLLLIFVFSHFLTGAY